MSDATKVVVPVGTPQYRSHKIVHALKIDAVKLIEGGTQRYLTFRDAPFGTNGATVREELFARHVPVPGDYYVVYADGYESFSPAKAFEDGYTAVVSEPPSDAPRQDFNVASIARVCHEANRAYCASIGDYSQKPWREAPPWQRQSAVNGVSFAMRNTSAGPSASHESWLAEKRAHGWKFGPVKDEQKKEHPCFVAYEELGAEQKAKDAVFLAVVRALDHLVLGEARPL